MGRILIKYCCRISVFVALIGLSIPAISQDQPQSASSLDPGRNKNDELSYLPSMKTETAKKKEGGFRLFSFMSATKAKRKYKGSYSWQLDQQVEEYKKRMKSVAKQSRKEERMERKPQYSDPSYFGHKRKPKKRKPGKRRLCKECLVVH